MAGTQGRENRLAVCYNGVPCVGSEQDMSTVIHCPDCGGVVGATRHSEHGYPCTCFIKPPPPDDPDDPSGTAMIDAPVEPQKICCMCGCDLKGKKRYRDSLGYWCKDCHKSDKDKGKPVGAPCKACGRIVRPETLTALDGDKICSRCLKERRDLRKAGAKRYKKIDDTHFEKHEKRRLLIIAGILVVLGAIIVLNRMGFLGW